MHVQFADPRWLWIGALVCAALGALFFRASRRRTRAIAAFAGTRPLTTVSETRRRVKQALLLLGVAGLFAALARPLWGFRWEETRREGIDLMFAFDTSKSMLATDLRPDRLTRAKLAVRDLVREFPGERYGLIAFAGDAFVQAPMTIDQAVFEESLDALDTSIIPRGGTDIASAIRAASLAMASEPERRKLLLLLSDGEDLAGDAVTAAADAGRHGLTIYTVGVGTAQGELIPIVGADGQHDLIRDAAGQPVRSHLDDKMLAEIARLTGGAYSALGPSGRGLESLYRTQLSKYPRRTVEERTHKVYTERFQIPLGVAIGCLLLELAVGERKRRSQIVRGAGAALPHTTAARGATPTAGAAAALFLLLGAGRARAATAPPAPSAGGVPAYNEGTGAYRKHDFAAARDRFQAATRANDLALQANAYYDLGNARYRIGQATQAKDVPTTITAWKGALAAYDGALSLQRNDADAKFNRALVARRLAALEEQQKQKENQQQKNQQQQQPKSGQNQKSSGSSAQQQGGGGQKQDGKNGPQQSGGKNEQQQNAQQQAGKSGQQQSAQQSGQQGKNGQQAKDDPENSAQNGQPQGSQGQQKSGEQQPGQQQAGQQNPGQHQTPTPAAAGNPIQATGETPPASGTPRAAADQRGDETRRQAGALSRGEANQLLNSVDGQLQRLPMAGFDRRPSSNDNEPVKDW